MSSSAGKVLMRPRGTYDANETYLILDWVLYQGRPYVAKQTTTGNLPTDTDYWQILLDFPINVDSAPTENSNNLVSSGGVYTALGAKQDTLTFDSSPTQNSDNPVKSGGVYTALGNKQDTLTFDNAPTQNSDNPVKSGGVYTALGNKQDTLTFDNSPAQNSNNPVKSGGVYTALAGKQNSLTFDNAPTQNSDNPVKSGGVYTALAAKQDTLTFDNAPTQNSNNPVKSGGVYTALAGKQNTLTFDSAPTSGSSNPVTSGGVYTALQNAGHTIKDNTSTFTKRAYLQFKGFHVEDDPTNNATIIMKSAPPTIVTWANGTDAQIKAMLDAYYNGVIDIHDYWSVGDERTVTLAAMEATGVGESHPATTVTLVLMNAGGKTLSDDTTECAFVVGIKEALTPYGYMNSTNTNSGGWRDCSRRTWCNSVFYNAVPSAIRSIFKQFKNKSGTGGGSSSGTYDTTDYFALPAEIEVFGKREYSGAGEGTQFKYYETAANRIKLSTDTQAASHWWERSPRSGNSVSFCFVATTGTAYLYNASSTCGLSPFGCI